MIARISMFIACIGPLCGLAADLSLHSLAAVRGLSPEQAQLGHLVSLEATVTFFNPNGVFIHEGGEGVYVRFTNVTFHAGMLHPGTRLRVEARTTAGNFLPDLDCFQYEILGDSPLPKPVPVSQENLFSPGLDCQWVEVPGVIVGAEGQVGPHFALAVEVFGWTLKILVPTNAITVRDASALMQQRVTFRAVAATVYNKQRQMTGRYFLMPSLEYISPEDEQATPSTIRVMTVEELLRSDTSSLNSVRLRGIVTGSREGELYVRGAGGSLRVIAAQASEFLPGDLIEAEGFAAVAAFRPMLRARRVTRIGKDASPKPIQLDPATVDLTVLPAELLLVEADVLGVREELAAWVLQCQSGELFFEAMVPLPATLPESLAPGCRVRLIGNCELMTSQPLPRSQWVDGFRLHLRGPDDLAVIKPAPWWTLERILLGMGILSVAALAVLFWNIALRRRVGAQTEIIGSQIEREAVLHERQRIARELHDSLEQEMTGVAIQLRNVRHRLAQDPSGAGEALQLAQEMIRHCRQEARTSIRDLRSVALGQGGIEGAIRDLISPLVEESKVKFTLNLKGSVRRLDARLENDVLRVAQEATANALHHGSPKSIEITLEFTADAIELSVRDDGCGFDTSKPAPRGHFGLLGMHERANQRHARLTIDSGPGQGTIVWLRVPVVTPVGTRDLVAS